MYRWIMVQACITMFAFLFLGQASITHAAPPSTVGLVSLWNFDTNFADSFGSNNGTAVGSAVISSSNPRIGSGSLLLNGLTSYVDMGNPGSLKLGASDWTISFWAKTNVATPQALITKGRNSSDKEFQIELRASNKLAVAIENNGNNASAITLNSVWPLGEWFHAAASFDKDTLLVTMYINGVAVISTSSVNQLPDLFTAPFQIGQSFYSTTSPPRFNGNIDHVRVYSRTLSDIEITDLFTEGVDTAVPGAVANLAVGTPAANSLNLTWIAPGDDGIVGTAALYDIRYRTDAPITEANWDTSTQVTGEPAPLLGGTAQAMTVSGLAPATTYYFALKTSDEASNTSLVSNSPSGTTLAPPDTIPPNPPTVLPPTNITGTSITLNWNAATDNVGVAGYQVYRKNGTFVGTTTLLALTHTGLTPATTYNYFVFAYDAAGNVSASSTQMTATTLDTISPSAPTNLAASSITESSALLAWTAATDNKAVTGYKVFRNGIQIATTSASTTYAVTGLTSATTYTFAVSAFDAAGNTGPVSASLLVTTSDVTAPSVPSGLNSSNITGTSAKITWSPATDNIGVTGYKIFRDAIQIATSATTTYTNTGLTPVVTYSYQVSAYDAAGNESAQSSAHSVTTLDTVNPSAPGTPTATSVTAISVSLSWPPATDNVGVTSYSIIRDGVTIGSSIDTTFTDATPWPVTTYSYTVTARDAAGNFSPASGALSITTLDIVPPTPPGTGIPGEPPDTTAPSIPTGVIASSNSETEAVVSWSASTDNTAVTGYIVSRDGVTIATATDLTITDTGLVANTTYGYRVAAFDEAGNVSAFSTSTSVTTPDTTPPSAPIDLVASDLTETSATISWGASTDNVLLAGYVVLRDGVPTATTSTSTMHTLTGLAVGQSYTITIQAFDHAGLMSAPSASITVTTADLTPPSVPSGLFADAVTDTSATLSWDPSTDTVGVSGYHVYRDGIIIATTTTPTYTDTGLASVTTYAYEVGAFDAAGNTSALSTSLSVTTIDIESPTAPSALSASAITDTEFTVSWTAATDNVGVVYYTVFKDGINVGTTSATSFVASELTASTAYSMTVTATDAVGNSSTASEPLSVTTLFTVLSCPALPTATRIVRAGTPAELSAALLGAEPGDHIAIKGGTYAGDFDISALGTLGSPVVIRPADGTPVILEGSFTFGGLGTRLWGAQLVFACN